MLYEWKFVYGKKNMNKTKKLGAMETEYENIIH
jgi:hypothetical protein